MANNGKISTELGWMEKLVCHSLEWSGLISKIWKAPTMSKPIGKTAASK